jgi:hypothetical protein
MLFKAEKILLKRARLLVALARNPRSQGRIQRKQYLDGVVKLDLGGHELGGLVGKLDAKLLKNDLFSFTAKLPRNVIAWSFDSEWQHPTSHNGHHDVIRKKFTFSSFCGNTGKQLFTCCRMTIYGIVRHLSLSMEIGLKLNARAGVSPRSS